MENQTEELVLTTSADDTIDRFDFENDLLRFTQILDDIDLLYEYVLDSNDLEFTRDKIANYLLGLKTIYNLKSNKVYDTLEHLIGTGQIK